MLYLVKRLKERQVGRGCANDDRVGVIPSFHKAPRVAVVRISGAGNLIGKLVASEAGVVLLRDAGQTNVRSVRKHTCENEYAINESHGCYTKYDCRKTAELAFIKQIKNTECGRTSACI